MRCGGRRWRWARSQLPTLVSHQPPVFGLRRPRSRAPAAGSLLADGDAFAERNVMESLPDLRPRLHPCGLMLAAWITLRHFSVSSAISLPNWAGDPGSGVPPRSARRALILGSASAALTSLLSLSTISAGVFVGPPTPYHWRAS